MTTVARANGNCSFAIEYTIYKALNRTVNGLSDASEALSQDGNQ